MGLGTTQLRAFKADKARNQGQGGFSGTMGYKCIAQLGSAFEGW